MRYLNIKEAIWAAAFENQMHLWWRELKKDSPNLLAVAKDCANHGDFAVELYDLAVTNKRRENLAIVTKEKEDNDQ